MIRPPWSTRTLPAARPIVSVRDEVSASTTLSYGFAMFVLVTCMAERPMIRKGNEALRSPPDTSSSVRRSGATDNILSIGSPQAIRVSNASSCRGSRRAVTPVPVG